MDLIPKQQVVVVSGDPRSGTSLMMQTLALLGAPISGDEFPRDRPQRQGEQEGRSKQGKAQVHARKLNPKGFFEVPGVVMRGLPEIRGFGGTAIKIISPGLARTPVGLIYKGILCLRDPRFVAESQTNLQNGIEVEGEPLKTVASPKRYVLEMGNFLKWYSIQEEEYRNKFTTVDYNDFLTNPTLIINKIISHLDISPTPKQIQAAINNIDVNLKRSDNIFPGWQTKHIDTGEVADEIFNALKSNETIDAVVATAKLDSIMDTEKREKSLVYKDELCCNVTGSFLRQFNSSKKLRDILANSSNKRISNGEPFTSSPDYTGETKNTYIIDLPIDVGGTSTFHKVSYLNQELTKEDAQRLHEHRRRTTSQEAV